MCNELLGRNIGKYPVKLLIPDYTSFSWEKTLELRTIFREFYPSNFSKKFSKQFFRNFCPLRRLASNAKRLIRDTVKTVMCVIILGYIRSYWIILLSKITNMFRCYSRRNDWVSCMNKIKAVVIIYDL